MNIHGAAAARRLAALRVGVAALLLADVLSYLSARDVWFSARYFGNPAVASWPRTVSLNWSLFRIVDARLSLHPAVIDAALALWLLAAILLLVGLWTRLAAIVAWALTLSFLNLNPDVANAGDSVQIIALFYLMITRPGEAWSIDSLRRGRRGASPEGPAFVNGWALRLLIAQLALIYVASGAYKLMSPEWRNGHALYDVLCDVTLARVSCAAYSLPLPAAWLLSWTIISWETGFPLWIALRWTRRAAWIVGALFHVAVTLTLEVGAFGPAMLALYLPLIPWERWPRVSSRP